MAGHESWWRAESRDGSGQPEVDRPLVGPGRERCSGGRYRCVGGSVSALLRILTIGWIAGRLTRRRIGVLAVREGPTRFEPLADLCVNGDIGIHIDRTFALEELPLALAHVGEGRALGKVVVTPT